MTSNIVILISCFYIFKVGTGPVTKQAVASAVLNAERSLRMKEPVSASMSKSVSNLPSFAVSYTHLTLPTKA